MDQAERDVPGCATCGDDVDPTDETVIAIIGADDETRYWCDDDCIARFPIGERAGDSRD